MIAGRPARHRAGAGAGADELSGNAYTSDADRVPDTLRDAREAFAGVGGRPLGPRRRRRRPLREHGRRRAGRVRGRGHRLGAAPRLRAAVTHDRAPASPSSTRPPRQPVDRGGAATSADETDAAIERGARGVRRLAARSRPASGRALLRRFADVVDAHVEELAELEVRNAGHTWATPAGRPATSATACTTTRRRPSGSSAGRSRSPAATDLTFHEPLGVVGIIVPWNFPMPIAGWGFAPALAAGNTVVLKPAELTPLTAIRIGELALRGRAPRAACSPCCPGKGSVVGERFVTHPLVRKVCFTGSTEVGKRIMAGCAEQVKRVTLELGGKSANIVFADADLAAAAAAAPYAVFDNAGQDCCARSRILVERSAYDEFLGLLEPAVTGLRVLDPADEASEMGPLISAGQRRPGPGLPRRRRDVAFAGSAPGGDGFWVAADRGHRRRPRRPDLARGGLRPGRRGDAVRRRGRRGRAGQRHRVRPVGLDLHQRPRPRRCGSPAASRPATSASTPTPRCATGRRSAATSSPASAASSARTRPRRSPRRRTSSSPTDPRPAGPRRKHHGRTPRRQGRRRDRRAARASAWRPSGASSRRARGSSSATSTTSAATRWSASWAARTC